MIDRVKTCGIRAIARLQGPTAGSRFAVARAAPHRGRSVNLLLILAAAVAGSAAAEEEVHRLRSPRQNGETTVRVFTPEQVHPLPRLRTLYVLPVEAGGGTKWGDPASEIRRTDLANRHQLIVVLPTFSALPWYADHPTSPDLRQESYILEDVLPLVEQAYPADPRPEGRLLAGFSKSGWGAWSLLLRNPETFARAAAWDAPLMQAAPNRYGMRPIFADQANFERYRLTRLVRERAEILRRKNRLVLTGYFDSFRAHHIAMHGLLTELGIPHDYRDGPMREHHWESGWLEETVALLVNREGSSPRLYRFPPRLD